MLRELVKKTSIGRLIQKSCGDFRFPLMAIGWRLAGWLTRRRHVQVGEVRFSLPCNNWITHFRWYLFKKKEKEIRYFIDKHLQNGDIFFDIGANIGVFSVYAATKYKNISVYCFEPEYSNLSLLKENALHNQLSNRMHIYSLAISDFSGLSQLHIQDLTPGAACHTESSSGIAKTDEGFSVVWKEGVATMTLDSVCDLLNVVPNVIKLDTDGNEEKILKGASKTLKNPKLKSIAIEMPMDQKKFSNCREMLKSAGFTLEWNDPDKTRNEIWVKTGSN